MISFKALLCIGLTWTLAIAKKCQNITIPVQISSSNAVFNLALPQSGIEVTDFAVNFGRQGHNYTQEILRGYKLITGSYQISATHCAPDNGDSNTLQILTHGVGFDKSYWDLAFKNFNYSYVNTAVDHYGYSTLAWDRLGIAGSSHGDPIDEIQTPLTQAALSALTKLARNYAIPNWPSRGYSKVVHVGHSFGSVLSYAVARDELSASDGLILQGFAMNGTFFPDFMFGGNLIPITDITSAYAPGYLAAGNTAAFHTNFLAPGQFDPDMVTYAYAHSQPATIGELLTIGSSMYGPSHFAGPVMVVTGERDLPFCGGDCYATGDPNVHSIPDATKQVFPDAKNVNITIVPGGGHGLNMEYGHDQMFKEMNEFLGNNGLAASKRTRGTG